MCEVMILLIASSSIFIYKNLPVAALSIMPPFVSLIFMYLTFHDIKIFLTSDELIIKFWLFTTKTELQNMENFIL